MFIQRFFGAEFDVDSVSNSCKKKKRLKSASNSFEWEIHGGF